VLGIGRLIVAGVLCKWGRGWAVDGGKVSEIGSGRERGRNEGGFLLFGKWAVLSEEILWSGLAGAAAGGKCGVFFLRRSWAPGAGVRMLSGGCFYVVSVGGASKASVKGGQWPP